MKPIVTTTIIPSLPLPLPSTWGSGCHHRRKALACQKTSVCSSFPTPPAFSHWVLQTQNPVIRPAASLSRWCQKAPQYIFKEEERKEVSAKVLQPSQGRWYCLNVIQLQPPPTCSLPPNPSLEDTWAYRLWSSRSSLQRLAEGFGLYSQNPLIQKTITGRGFFSLNGGREG